MRFPPTISPDFGRAVRAAQLDLRQQVLSRGREGLISLTKALNYEGFKYHEEYAQEICRIIGPDHRRRIFKILKAEDGRHWLSDDWSLLPQSVFE